MRAKAFTAGFPIERHVAASLPLAVALAWPPMPWCTASPAFCCSAGAIRSDRVRAQLHRVYERFGAVRQQSRSLPVATAYLTGAAGVLALMALT